ncbi:hypothetical protein Tco_0743475 [Tanacetum coccineum]
MAPKRATRSTPGTENITTTTVTNAQLQEMIDQGVTAALVSRDANRNGDDSYTSGTVSEGMNTLLTKYCPRGEMEEDELEMWNLKVKGTDVVTYNQHFQELALMCDRMFPEESDKVEKYVGGLPGNDTMAYQQQLPKREECVQLTPLGLVKERYAGDSFLVATSASSSTMAVQCKMVQTCKMGRQQTKTVGVLLLLTIREPSLAMNVRIKALL